MGWFKQTTKDLIVEELANKLVVNFEKVNIEELTGAVVTNFLKNVGLNNIEADLVIPLVKNVDSLKGRKFKKFIQSIIEDGSIERLSDTWEAIGYANITTITTFRKTKLNNYYVNILQVLNKKEFKQFDDFFKDLYYLLISYDRFDSIKKLDRYLVNCLNFQEVSVKHLKVLKTMFGGTLKSLIEVCLNNSVNKKQVNTILNGIIAEFRNMEKLLEKLQKEETDSVKEEVVNIEGLLDDFNKRRELMKPLTKKLEGLTEESSEESSEEL